MARIPSVHSVKRNQEANVAIPWMCNAPPNEAAQFISVLIEATVIKSPICSSISSTDVGSRNLHGNIAQLFAKRPTPCGVEPRRREKDDAGRAACARHARGSANSLQSCNIPPHPGNLTLQQRISRPRHRVARQNATGEGSDAEKQKLSTAAHRRKDVGGKCRVEPKCAWCMWVPARFKPQRAEGNNQPDNTPVRCGGWGIGIECASGWPGGELLRPIRPSSNMLRNPRSCGARAGEGIATRHPQVRVSALRFIYESTLRGEANRFPPVDLRCGRGRSAGGPPRKGSTRR